MLIDSVSERLLFVSHNVFVRSLKHIIGLMAHASYRTLV